MRAAKTALHFLTLFKRCCCQYESVQAPLSLPLSISLSLPLSRYVYSVKCKLVRRITSHAGYTGHTYSHTLYPTNTQGISVVKIFSVDPAVECEPVPVKGFPDNSSTWTNDAVAEWESSLKCNAHTKTKQCSAGAASVGGVCSWSTWFMSPPIPALKAPSASLRSHSRAVNSGSIFKLSTRSDEMCVWWIIPLCNNAYRKLILYCCN